MGVVKSFCMCCNVRSGSLFCGIYTLLSSALYIGMILMRFVGCKLVHISQAHAAVTYLTFVLFGLLALFSITLVIGVHMDRRELILPWIIQTIICILFGTATVCWIYIYTLRQGKGIHVWESLILTYHIFNVVITVYCIICVFSQFQELALGRGTWRHHRRRQRNRSRRQTVAIFVTDMGVETAPIDGGHFNISCMESEEFTGGRCLAPTIPPPPYELPPYADKPPPYSTLARQGDLTCTDRQIVPINPHQNSNRTGTRVVLANNRNINVTRSASTHRPTLSQLARQATSSQQAAARGNVPTTRRQSSAGGNVSTQGRTPSASGRSHCTRRSNSMPAVGRPPEPCYPYSRHAAHCHSSVDSEVPPPADSQAVVSEDHDGSQQELITSEVPAAVEHVDGAAPITAPTHNPVQHLTQRTPTVAEASPASVEGDGHTLQHTSIQLSAVQDLARLNHSGIRTTPSHPSIAVGEDTGRF